MATPDRDTLVAWYGTDEPVPEPRRLVAGPLSADLVDGGLREVRYGDVEVLRGVAYVVRDRDWGTYAPALTGLAVDQGAGGFSVRYQARIDGPDGSSLAFAATILGTTDGTLIFDVTATPEGDFDTNRCGFCVLHPIRTLAGTPVTVEHTDGSIERAVLPDLIAPWQPFKAMRAITHDVGPGLRATCRLEGDAFEMEDQRAWSDASYKTYVRPLALPWPYRLPDGVAQRQTVSLSFHGTGHAAPARSAQPATVVRVGDARGLMPGLGLVITPEEAGAVLQAQDRLRQVAPQSLLFHFDPTAGHGLAALRGFAAVQATWAAEAVLECVVPCRDDPARELATVAGLVREAGLRLDTVMVSPAVDRQSTPPGSAWPDCPPLEAVYAGARRAFPGVRLGGGMFSYFTELNRKRPPFALLDVVSHATCPIVHAADDRSVMQSLEALPFIARSVRAMAGPMPYRIGPSTIGMRQNPYGSRTMDNPDRRRVAMANRDPRQDGLFAATWLVGYVAALVEADLETVTVGALTGAFGLLDAAGDARPVFHAARILAGLGGRPRRACVSGAEDRVLGVAADAPDGSVSLCLANPTAEPQAVRIEAPAVRQWRAAVLDRDTIATARSGAFPPDQATTGALTLAPYAVALLRGA